MPKGDGTEGTADRGNPLGVQPAEAEAASNGPGNGSNEQAFNPGMAAGNNGLRDR